MNVEFAEMAGSALSPRERQILGLLAEGYDGPEIGRRLFLAPATVKTAKTKLMAKLGRALPRRRCRRATGVACWWCRPACRRTWSWW